MIKFYFANGEFVKKEPGYATGLILEEIYEVFRLEHGVALFLDDHLNRLYFGLLQLDISNIPSKPKMMQQLCQFLKSNKKEKSNIRVSILYQSKNLRGIYCTFSHAESSYPSDEFYSSGVKCGLINTERHIPRVKKANPGLRNETDNLIREEKLFETFLVNRNGNITEGSRTNVFFIKGSQIYTAPDNEVLNGIMRQKVLEICRKLNYHVIFKSVNALNEMPAMDAGFITGTSPRVLPVKQIAHVRLDPGHPMVRNIMMGINQMINEHIKASRISPCTPEEKTRRG